MKHKIVSLAFFLWTACLGLAMAAEAYTPLNDSMGADGLADGFNALEFKGKSVYINACKKLPDFTGEEIYILDTNIGEPGDNVILVYPNEAGLIGKIIILARDDSQIGKQGMFEAVMEECITIFNVACIDRENGPEIGEMLQALKEAFSQGKSGFWSTGTGRRYIIEAFRRRSNGIVYGNVRITAQL